MARPTLEQIMAGYRAAIGTDSGLGGTIKVDITDVGTLLIDGKSVPNTVTEGTGKTGDVTATLTLDTFQKLVKGEIDGTTAYSEGKLVLDGDTTLIIKLIPIFMKMVGS